LQSSPLLGSGFGNFVDYYPLYGDGRVYGLVDRAHNDYLEALADLGWIAGICYLAAPIGVGILCVRGVSRRRKRTLPAVGLGIAVAIGLQSLVEFPMQIPAIAATFAIMLGMAAAQSWSSQETAPSANRTRHST
jgi:O-antigen ligase